MDHETALLCSLMELHHGQSVEKKTKSLAKKVSWAKGWPENDQAFWNTESFMWGYKIEKKIRELITSKLSFLSGKNLDLGCGAYSYIPSIGFDFSEKMLQLNEQCHEKIQGSLEEKLPFSNNSFDSITLIFVLNYVKAYEELLLECQRVVRSNGHVMVILSAVPINDWQRQKEVNSFDSKKWITILKKAKFSVSFEEKEKLWFFKCSVG